MGTLSVLRETNIQDIPATLRKIADGIEAGEYGEAHGCVLVLGALNVEVFYTGRGEAGPNAHLLLHAGAAWVLNGVLAGKG